MKKNVNYIPREQIMAVVSKSGLPTEEKKGWTLVGNYSTGGARIYIPHTKSVGRIDLSAFTLDPATFGTRDLGGESFGNVKQQVDFSLPPAQVLVNIEAILLALRELPKPEKAPRKAPEKSASTPAPASTEPDPVAQRRALILKKAQELMALRGMGVGDAIAQAQADMDASSAS